MIKRLRKRFIRIATLAVTGVMLVLCVFGMMRMIFLSAPSSSACSI